MNIVQIEIVNFNLFILEGSMRYLYFTSEHCPSCQIIKPIISRHAEIAVIDIEKQQEQAVKYGVMSIPTLLILDNNDSVEQQITGTRIGKWLKENFKQ